MDKRIFYTIFMVNYSRLMLGTLSIIQQYSVLLFRKTHFSLRLNDINQKNMAKKPQKTPMGQIRIIGGKWRGRKLPVLNSQGLRPTTDRVKETLFNWLMPIIHDAHCLDCFAGSGGLGIEALSRYARETTFVEYERDVAQQIKANLALLNADNGHVIHDSALSFLAKQGTPYNVIFLDPPFHKGMLSQTIQLLENNGWLAQNSYIYIEEEINAETYPLPANWILHREKIAGQVAYRLYIRSISV